MVSSLNTDQQFTAAGTAITDKGGLIADIVGNMGQVQRSCPLQNRQQLLGGLLRGEAASDQKPGPFSQGDADTLHRVTLSAILIEVMFLVTAVTDSDSAVIGCLDNFSGAFVAGDA